MPKVSFQFSDSKFKPCPHGGVHEMHVTKDRRSLGICMMGDGHLQSLKRYLENVREAMLKEAFFSAAQYYGNAHGGPAPYYDSELVDIEHKLTVVRAEQRRRRMLKGARN